MQPRPGTNFAQVLAGVANNVIVVDPDGFVPSGGEAVVPYELTAADSRSDVIVLSPASDAIQVALEAPDGPVIDGSSGAQVVAAESYQTLRVALDPTVVATPAGPGSPTSSSTGASSDVS